MRNPKTLLDSVIQSYLLYCQHLKPRTRQGYAQQLGFFVKWLRANGYDAVLGDVEASVVNQYVMERQRISPFTARAASSSLKAFGSWLARVGIVMTADGACLPKCAHHVSRKTSDAR